MYDVIVVGNSSMDMFVDTGKRLFTKRPLGGVDVPFGRKILVKDLEYAVGGSGTNVATAIKRLGLSVSFVSKLGRDQNGTAIVEHLEREGIGTDYLVVEDGQTDIAIILDAHGHDRTILAYKKMNANLLWDEIHHDALDTRWFYFSTMTGRSLETQREIARLAARKGISVMYNPSSYIMYDRRDIALDIVAHSTIVAVNLEEASIITGREGNWLDLARELLNLGPEIAVITDGANGAMARSADGAWLVHPNPAEEVESTGAGDGFAAAFLAGYILTGSISEALNMGAAEAESIIGHRGAIDGQLTHEEMKAVLSEKPHRIERLL